jgi:soluble lytic murein transglycosylase-like protein
MVFYHPSFTTTKAEREALPKPQAPPDLARLREPFSKGLEVLQQGDGAEAVKQFGSFTFGPRQVEEYRLYFLAQGHQLASQPKLARAALAQLWSRKPRMAYASDVAFNLASLYTEVADWSHAAEVYRGLGARSETPVIDAAAQWSALESAFNDGDVAGVAYAARRIAIDDPKSAQAGPAIAVLRSLGGIADNEPLRLGLIERLKRAENLFRDGAADEALTEITALESAGLGGEAKSQLALDKGLALIQLRRYEDAVKQLEPLTGGAFKFAIPALYNSSRAYRILASSVNPIVNKVVVERKQVGTRKVKVKPKKKGGKARIVTRPKFANVKKTIQLIDLAKKAKKDNWDHLGAERLKDLLRLPLQPAMRLEVLNTLVTLAEAKNQDAFEQELIPQIVKIDPLADIGLQHFWDKAWAAYLRGDLATAKQELQFLSSTYRNPNIRRQSDYWYARAMERSGEKQKAAAIYAQLAAVPYDDIYALHARARGAPAHDESSNPLRAKHDDWTQIAEREMPAELRLAYELNALSDARDARTEIQRNANVANQKYANALLADLSSSMGQGEQTNRFLRRAFPELATVEQNSVPRYFLEMYYPMKYHDDIMKYSKKHGVDPYVVTALIHQESAFNPKARSSVGATGLMQLMPATGKELALRLHGRATPRLDDPATNIELGTAHLQSLIRLFGNNVELAVASYNAGQGNVMKWKRANSRPKDEFLESIPFPETRNYVKRVTILASSYRRFDQ